MPALERTHAYVYRNTEADTIELKFEGRGTVITNSESFRIMLHHLSSWLDSESDETYFSLNLDDLEDECESTN